MHRHFEIRINGAASDIFSTFAHVFSFSSDDQHGYWGPIGVTVGLRYKW